MTRVKRGTSHIKKRRKLLKQVKGFTRGRKKLIKLAKTATIKAGANAYRDRRLKKRSRRALWQIKINAFARQHDTTYSKLMNQMRQAGVELDRKTLADLAENNSQVLAKVLQEIQEKAPSNK